MREGLTETRAANLPLLYNTIQICDALIQPIINIYYTTTWPLIVPCTKISQFLVLLTPANFIVVHIQIEISAFD